MKFKEIIRVMTLWDKILILLLSGLTIFSFYIIKTIFPKGAEAAIELEGKNLGSYLLTEDRILKIKGSLGTTEIEIKDGRIRVLSSPCRDRICMKQGWIAHSGEAIICLPNRVMVFITGEAKSFDKSQDRYDAISW